MKTPSALLRPIGALLLALLVFVVLPSSTARASQGQCGDVDISVQYGGGNQICFVLEVEPSDCLIYVTTGIDNPSFPDPSRSGTTPIPPTFTVASGATICVPYGHTLCIKAFAYKALWTQSVHISYFCLHNPER